jgi:hypothetical protein
MRGDKGDEENCEKTEFAAPTELLRNFHSALLLDEEIAGEERIDA